MDPYLRALEAAWPDLPALVGAAEWPALEARLRPLLAAHRAGADEQGLLDQIRALLAPHPAARERVEAEIRRQGAQEAPSQLRHHAARRRIRDLYVFGPEGQAAAAAARNDPVSADDPSSDLDAAARHYAEALDMAKTRERAAASRPTQAEPPPPTAAESALVMRGGDPAAARAASAARAREKAVKPRWILARVFTAGEGAQPRRITSAFRAAADHEVEVMVGAERKDWLAARGPDEASIDTMLPAGESHELSVAFFIPALGVQQTASLTLPPAGPTPKSVSFRFTAGAEESAIEAFICLVHRGRVLQTAVLSGRAVADPSRTAAGAALKLTLAIVGPPLGDLDRRRTFDAAVVAVRRPDGRPVAAALPEAAAGVADIVVFDQPRLGEAARGIREILHRIADEPDAFEGRLDSDASQELLRALAQAGAVLYDVIGKRLQRERAGRDLSRIQVVQVDPTAFIPVEFIYDLPAPASTAPLCRNWRKAIADGRCDPVHHPVDDVLGDLAVVCPSGFWSVSKLIERQMVQGVDGARLGASDFGIRTEPSAARPCLGRLTAALFAWSERLDHAVPGSSAAVLQSLNEATGNRAVAVSTWRDWAGAVSRRRPGLLVLLSHTVTDAGPAALEIGPERAGERRTLGQVNEKLIKVAEADAPVVFLLGCDTALAERELHSFVARFRDRGAAVVVGTITPVRGESAAAVVRALVGELRAAGRPGPVRLRFGEVVRSARRRLLAGGELTALCAASFGDADWLVGAGAR